MRILKAFLIASALMVSACTAWFGWAMWITSHELDAHIRTISTVDDALGFSYGTPYEDGVEVFVITEVVPGGLMDRAGLKVGDYPDCSIASLYERMVFGQGQQVEVPVARNKQRIVVRVTVPPLVLRDDPRKLHWYFLRH